MNMKIYGLILFIFTAVTLIHLSCTIDPVSGGTETGDAVGILYNPNGSRAANATIYIVSVDHNPKPIKGVRNIDSTTTNDTGGFFLDSMPEGYYNILGSGDSGISFNDSVYIQGDTTNEDLSDTLGEPGTLRGVVALQPGDDSRTVFILVFGTQTWTAPIDSIGNFTIASMAEGTYHVRLLTTLDDYDPLDTNLTVFSGVDTTLEDTIYLPFTGIPIPQGLILSYDNMKQIVTLTWNACDTNLVKGYNVYRKHSDSDFVKINTALITDTTYSDSSAIQDEAYEYKIKAVDKSDDEGEFSEGVSVVVVSGYTLIDTFATLNGELINFDMDNQGNLYCFNYTQQKVQVLDSSGVFKQDWDVLFQEGLSTFKWKKKIAVDDSSYIYVANYGTILKFDSSGNLIDTVYSCSESAKEVTALSFFKDTIFFSEYQDRNIHFVSTNGDSLFTLSNNWQAGDKLRSLDCDSAGNIYLYCEVQGTDRIQVFDKAGQFLHEIDADYGDMNVFISQGKLLLVGYEKVVCLDLHGNSIFQISVQTENPYTSPVGATFTNVGTLLVGFIEGYIAVYAQQ